MKRKSKTKTPPALEECACSHLPEPDAHRFDCEDCDVDTREIDEYYMVHDHVWKEAGMHPDIEGMLCIGCLEKRLRRLLRPIDFIDAPINRGTFPLSRGLFNRLTGL